MTLVSVGPVRPIPRGQHVEYLLDQAVCELQAGRTEVAITHLADAVRVAATKDGPVNELEVMRQVREVMRFGRLA